MVTEGGLATAYILAAAAGPCGLPDASPDALPYHMPSFENSSAGSEPEFFKMKLKKAPKPRDYECPHNSGDQDTLLKKLQEEQATEAAPSKVAAQEPAFEAPQEVQEDSRAEAAGEEAQDFEGMAEEAGAEEREDVEAEAAEEHAYDGASQEEQ